MKLNLACGNMVIPGYINVDNHEIPGIDIMADIREKLYPDNSVDEILMIHCIEHFTLDDARKLLKNALDMLHPGGKLMVEGPDTFKIVRNCDGNQFKSICYIFGDLHEIRKGLGYGHLWGWTGDLMKHEMDKVGFKTGPVSDGTMHKRPWRDFKVCGIKPV